MKLYSNKSMQGDNSDNQEKWGNANGVRFQEFLT